MLCSPSKDNRRFGEPRRFHFQCQNEAKQETSMKKVSRLFHYFTLKMEAACSSETSANFQWANGVTGMSQKATSLRILGPA
jgi:hypothetical protein